MKRLPGTSRRSLERLLVVGALYILIGGPIAVFVLLSFIDRASVLSGIIDMHSFTLGYYSDLFVRVDIAKLLQDSVSIAAASTLLSIVIGLATAYFVSRGSGHLPRRIYSLALAMWFVPAIALCPPIYDWFLRIGLYDNLVGMIALYSTVQASFVVVILAPYLDAFPRRIDEAASIEGITGLAFVFNILLPAVSPALEGLAALSFLMSWNELLYASLLTDHRITTLPVATLALLTGSHIDWGQIAALGSLSMLPIPIAIPLLIRGARYVPWLNPGRT